MAEPLLSGAETCWHCGEAVRVERLIGGQRGRRT